MKKKLFGLLACVMMFALALGIVACGETPENKDADTYTVTFVNGEQTVKTSSVEKGKALAAADFPADPTAPADMQFDGWYVGEEKLSVGFVPEADITAKAKFTDIGGTPVQYTVTFVVGEETVKTVTVEAGKKPAANDLPSDPTKDHYTFDGWYDSENNPFDENAVVNASATYTARFTQEDYLVTFEQDGEDDVTVWVTKTSGKLTATDIPTPKAVTDAFFLGWYNGDVKAAADVTITADTTFTAQFLTQADYAGIWYNDDEHVFVDFTNGVKVNKADLKKTLNDVTFNAEDGSLKGNDPDAGMYYDRWAFQFDGNTMTATHEYYDSTYDEAASDDPITLTKAEANFALAGTYHNDQGSSNYLEITDGGIVTHMTNGEVYYGRLIAEGDGYKLDVYTKESEHFLLNVKVDAKGNLVITGTEAKADYRGIYIKNSTVGQKFSYGETTLYVHTVDTEKVYVYSDKAADTHYYVTVDGVLEDGEIVTLTKEDETSVTHLIKIVGTYQFVFPNEERGTYILTDKANLTLDGFGSATLGDASPVDYYIVGKKVVAGGNGYQIDIAGGTYTELTKETADYVGKTFTNLDAKTYTVVFDGFGIIVEECGYNGTYYGTYTAEGTTLTTVMEDPDEVSKIGSGTYTLKEENKVLCNSDESVIYTREDYDLYSKLDQFIGANNGYWVKDGGNGEYIEIVIEGNAITKLDYNGEEIRYYCDIWYDGSAITCRLPKIKLTVEGGKLHVTSTDEGGINDTYTSTAKPVTEKNVFIGGWEGQIWNRTIKFWFDGYSKGIIIDGSSMDEFTYKATANTANFTVNGWEYTLTLNDETISGENEDDEMNTQNFTLSKGTFDKFEGVWNSGNEVMSFYRFTVTGYGYVLVKDMDGSYEEFVKYTISGDAIEFSADDYDFTCTLQEDGSMSVDGDLFGDPYIAKCPYTRETEQGGGEDLDALAGTWKYESYTFVFDGKGKVTINGSTTVDYEFDGTNISFTYDYEDWTGTYADGKITLSDEYGDSFGYNHVLEKQ